MKVYFTGLLYCIYKSIFICNVIFLPFVKRFLFIYYMWSQLRRLQITIEVVKTLYSNEACLLLSLVNSWSRMCSCDCDQDGAL